MSDDDYLVPGEVRPGMHVEIVQRPWQGVVTTPVSTGGTFLALRDGQGDDRETSWSFDAIGSIRLLPDPLPTRPGDTFIGRADTAFEGEPSRWMVVGDPSAGDGGRPGEPVPITYISQSYTEWGVDEARRFGLTRVPDPEVQP